MAARQGLLAHQERRTHYRDPRTVKWRKQSGRARPLELRRRLQARDLNAPTKAAVDILAGSSAREAFSAAGDGTVILKINDREVRVKFVVGEPRSEVAL